MSSNADSVLVTCDIPGRRNYHPYTSANTVSFSVDPWRVGSKR